MAFVLVGCASSTPAGSSSSSSFDSNRPTVTTVPTDIPTPPTDALPPTPTFDSTGGTPPLTPLASAGATDSGTTDSGTTTSLETASPSETPTSPTVTPSGGSAIQNQQLLLNGTWWMTAYTLSPAPEVTIPRPNQTTKITIADGKISTSVCDKTGTIKVSMAALTISLAAPAGTMCTQGDGAFDAIATGTVEYTVDRTNLILSKPGVGSLTFVNDCTGPSQTPTSGVMQPMYMQCRSQNGPEFPNSK